MASSKVTNIFVKGISQDLSKGNQDNQHALYNLDFDLVAIEGQELGIPHNSKGNKFQFAFPDLPPVYTIELDGFTGSPFLDINGVGAFLSVTNNTTIQDIYDQIIANYSAFIALGQYGVFFNNNQVYIVGYTLDPNPLIGPPNNGIFSTKIVNAKKDLSLIGWCQLDEDIIILTTAKTNISPTPVGTDGQVWKISYNDVNDTIPNMTGIFLTPMFHLVKNDILNFSLANEVYTEMLGRVESITKGSVYWTEDYNDPQAFNIYNPQAAAIPPGLMDWKPEINMSTPIINGILNGGSLKVGTYQAAYLCYSNDGAITSFSPASALIPLNEEPLNSTDWFNFDGAAEGTASGKSIRIKVPDIDTRYDFIKVAIIAYEIPNVPQIFIIIDQPITDSTMEFVFTGNENKVSVTIADFLNPQISFDKVKTFAQKKNRLYPTNTSTKKFDIDWDSRAYRFNNAGVYNLYSRTNTTPLSGTGLDLQLSTLPDTADAVNPYNDESGQVYGLFPANTYSGNWLPNQQFKYKTDGVTLGGEGVNLSYTFTVKPYIGDQDVTTVIQTAAGPFVDVTATNAAPSTEPIFTPAIPSLEPTIDGWQSIKNPFYSMNFPSYTRGEIYRFGLTVYNTKGQQSFVKWIGDIRIPEPWEDTTYDLTDINGTAIELRSIGLTFEIKTSTLPSDITGFRITRVKREDTDKTRFGTGVTTGVWRSRVKLASSPSGTFTPAWVLARKRKGQEETNAHGTTYGEVFHLDINTEYDPNNGNGIFPTPGNSTSSDTDSLGIIKFPDFDFDKYQVGQAFHIKKLHSYSVTNGITLPEPALDAYNNAIVFPTDNNLISPGNLYWVSDGNTASNTPWMHALLHKLNAVNSSSSDIVAISAQTAVGIDGIILGSTTGFVTPMGGDDFHNVVPFYFDFNYVAYPPTHVDIDGLTPGVSPDNEVCGLGSKSLFCYFNSAVYGNTMTGTKDEYQIISLCKFNQGAYGGPWRSSRYNNTYQACSDFIPKNLYNSGTQSIEVFGGDTYINLYQTPLFFFHWGETYGVSAAEPSGLASNYFPLAATQLALALSFPTESSINTDLRHGKYWNKNQINQYADNSPSGGYAPPHVPDNINDHENFAKFLSDDYFYNDAYSQQNNTLPYLSKPFLIETSGKNRVRTWASRVKFDKEIIDSWRQYPFLDYIDVEGTYGESVAINNLNEKLIVHQNRAVVQISSEELAVVPSGDQVLQAGTGKVLSRFDYISKETGTFHQFSVYTSPSALYHYDVRLQKLYRLGQGLEPLTDIEGLSAFFRDNVTGDIRDTDEVLLNKGIHGGFDTKYNRAYFTFEKTVTFTFATGSLNPDGSGTYTVFPQEIFDLYNVGQTIIINNASFIIQELTANNLTLNNFIALGKPNIFKIAFTIVYNEFLKAFEKFSGATPTIYLGTGKRFFSANPYDINHSVYVHDIGNYGQHYDKNPITSILKYNINYPDKSKIPTFRLDIIEYWTEVLDSMNNHVTLESLTGMIVENDYQTTANSLNPLTAQNTRVIRERTWRINMFRDYTDTTITPVPFLRDKYAKVTLMYDNKLNRVFKLHNVTSVITLSAY